MNGTKRVKPLQPKTVAGVAANSDKEVNSNAHLGHSAVKGCQQQSSSDFLEFLNQFKADLMQEMDKKIYHLMFPSLPQVQGYQYPLRAPFQANQSMMSQRNIQNAH